MDGIEDKRAELVRAMLLSIGEDPTRDGLLDTPSRVVRSWKELFGGYTGDAGEHLSKQFESTSSEMVHVNGIEFFSTCEHHMLPFHGTIDIAYLPTKHVFGLSKLARAVDVFARRLQIQERLVNEIADAIVAAMPSSLGCAVRARAVHMCMIARGARSSGTMTSTALRGKFLAGSRMQMAGEPTCADVRAEWLASLPR
jgi:GTP cyclohydrolase I